ncbi:cation:proton antiporter regulatory subunit [Natrialbaceae archaeon A-arb3/5]
MPITESDLPGVGKKFEIDLDTDECLVVVVHNTGRRDVFLKEERSSDSEKLFELSNDLAQAVGGIIEGSHFQPVESGSTETTLGDGTLIEWFDVESGAPLEGESIADILEDERISAAVVAVQRGPDVIPASNPEKNLQAGDTVVAVGSNEDLSDFETLLVADEGSDQA